MSALHYAARQNSLAIMELLLDHGAEVDKLAAGDLIPLHFAARFIDIDFFSTIHCCNIVSLDSRSAPGPHLRPARGRPSW